MPDFKVRYLILNGERGEPLEKTTIVEKIITDSVEKARAKAEDLATMRSKKTEKWILKAVEQVS